MPRKLFGQARDLVAVIDRRRFGRSARSTVVNAGEGSHIARGPCLRGVALKVGAHHALRVIEIGAAGIVPADSSVGVIGAVNLERSERLAVVAEDSAGSA